MIQRSFMVWGKSSGYVVVGMLMAGAAVPGSGGCGGSSKNRDDCEPGQTRICADRGFGQECLCSTPTAPPPDSGAGATGGFGPGGAGPGGSGPGGSGPAGSAGSGGAAGTRPIIEGGLGTGGVLGTAGIGGVAGTGAAGAGGAPATRLGAACASNVDCGAGLTCILPTSSAFDGEGPARGLCTASCAADSTICSRLGPNAVCLEFGSGTVSNAFCVQGCSFGPVGSGPNPNKCHGRDEVACAPLYGATGTACTTDANCRPGELCGDNQCFAVIPACLPQCNADSDCGTGRYCNPQTGLCGAMPKAGLALGQQCTQPPAGGTDACRGTCIGLVASAGGNPTAFTCAESCTIGAIPSCGWSGPASGTPAPGVCLFSSSIYESRGGPSVGDRGSCAQLCNCNADCLHPSLVCVSIGDTPLQMATRRRGFCTLPDGDPGFVSCTP